jgi:hypothetical protein
VSNDADIALAAAQSAAASASSAATSAAYAIEQATEITGLDSVGDAINSLLPTKISTPGDPVHDDLAATYTAKPTTDLGDWSLLRRDTSDVSRGVSWTTAQAVIARALGWAIVTDYGALGDASHDDTAAIQAALTAGRGGATTGGPVASVEARKVVWLPPGTFRLTAMLEATGIRGLVFAGSGKRLTKIMVDASMTNVIKGLGVSHGSVRDFTVYGNGLTRLVDDVIAWDWTPTDTTGSSYHCQFERIAIDSSLKFKNGISVGRNSGSYDVSAGMFRDITIDGGREVGAAEATYWQSGIYLGSSVSGNVLNHYLDGCRIHFVKNAVRVDSVNSVSITRSETSHVENVVYKSGPGVLSIADSRFEESYRLIDTLGGASYSSSATVDNVIWGGITSAPPDNYYLRWNYGGTLILRNVFVQPQGYTRYIQCSSAKPITVLLEGYYSPTGAGYEQDVVEAVSTTNVFIESKGFYNLNADQSIGLRRPDRKWSLNVASEALIGSETSNQDAFHTFQQPSAGTSQGGRGLRFKKGTTNEWLLYQTGAGTDLYLRDMVNSTMAAQFTQGAGNAAVAAFVGDVRAGRTVRSQAAVTGSRPSASTVGAGARFYDATLSKPIWSDGTVWRDAAGTAV